tara:strand:- start:4124 stop:5440 length:1317 start_codon:yes stop_codon:yes gene_type:complete
MTTVTLTKDQDKAADAFLQFLLDPNENEFALQGFSGCGKTFLTQHLIELAETQADLLQTILDSPNPIEIVLTALTHKAAAAIHEATGIEANTIHSFLGLTVYDDYQNGRTKLRKTKDYKVAENTILFIDEASMADDSLLQMIRESTYHCKVVYILDPKQLLPVFENKCPVDETVNLKATLSEIVRQKQNSPIAALGAQLREAIDGGEFPDLTQNTPETQHMEGKAFQNAVDAHFTDPDYDPANVKILAWSNNRVSDYNNYVRALHYQSPLYQPGERLIANSVIKNVERVIFSNEEPLRVISSVEDELYGIKGQLVKVESVFPKKHNNKHSLFVPFRLAEANHYLKVLKKEALASGLWGDYYRVKEAFCDLRPAYASTVHKSQGSTFHTVFIDLSDIGRNNKREEVARLLYVAITRATTRVFFYGQLPEKYQPSKQDAT